jgi:hypothetical protein
MGEAWLADGRRAGAVGIVRGVDQGGNATMMRQRTGGEGPRESERASERRDQRESAFDPRVTKQLRQRDAGHRKSCHIR